MQIIRNHGSLVSTFEIKQMGWRGVESETGLDNFLRADTDRYKSPTLTTPPPSIRSQGLDGRGRRDDKDNKRWRERERERENGGGTVTNDNKSNDRFPGELASLSPIIRYKIESILAPRIRFGPRLLPTTLLRRPVVAS